MVKLATILKEQNIKRILIIIITVLSPFIFAEIYMRFNGYGLLSVYPYSNDEASYFLQIKGMLAYGAPLGYNGFNGGTAQLSTFAFHGFGCLIPYFLFAKLFGLHFYTITLVNLLMMSGAMLFYVLVLRPTNKQLLFVLACTSIGISYFHTAMMEVGYMAYTIVLATLFIRISRKNELPYKILSFFFIIFMSFAKPTFAILFFPLLALTIKSKKMLVNLLFSFIGMAFFMIIFQLIFSKFSSPYWTSHYSFDINLLANEPFQTTWMLLKIIIKNFFGLMPMAIRNSTWGVLHAILIYSLILYFIYYITIELYSYYKFRNFKSSKAKAWLLITTGITFFGIIIMWTGLLQILYMTIRNFMSFLFFIFIIITELEKDISGKVAFAWQLSIIIGITILLGSTEYMGEERGHVSTDFIANVKFIEEFYAKNINISPDKSRWENTIASVGGVSDIYWLNAPAGTGWQLYWGDLLSINEKYVIMGDSEVIGRPQEINHYIEQGYFEIARHGDVFVLQNPIYE